MEPFDPRPFQDAFDAVLTDTRATTDLSLEVVSTPGPSEGLVMVTVEGTGNSVPAHARGPELVVLVATHVQDVVSEALASARASNWPICPQHRSTHPLEPRVLGARACWVCPESENEVAEIGRLRL